MRRSRAWPVVAAGARLRPPQATLGQGVRRARPRRQGHREGAEFCRRADQRGLLKNHVKAARLDPISRQVIRKMKQRGEIR
jgi:hypothetical protein